MWEGNVLQASVHRGPCITPSTTVLLVSRQYTSYCNAVLFKLGLNREIYSWVVQFLNYFISFSEIDVERGKPEVEEGKIVIKVFIYFFFM